MSRQNRLITEWVIGADMDIDPTFKKISNCQSLAFATIIIGTISIRAFILSSVARWSRQKHENFGGTEVVVRSRRDQYLGRSHGGW